MLSVSYTQNQLAKLLTCILYTETLYKPPHLTESQMDFDIFERVILIILQLLKSLLIPHLTSIYLHFTLQILAQGLAVAARAWS